MHRSNCSIPKTVPDVRNLRSPFFPVDIDNLLAKFIGMAAAIFQLELLPSHLKPEAEHRVLPDLPLLLVILRAGPAINFRRHVEIDVDTFLAKPVVAEQGTLV